MLHGIGGFVIVAFIELVPDCREKEAESRMPAMGDYLGDAFRERVVAALGLHRARDMRCRARYQHRVHRMQLRIERACGVFSLTAAHETPVSGSACGDGIGIACAPRVILRMRLFLGDGVDLRKKRADGPLRPANFVSRLI